ncbi:HTH domain-containing protein [Anaeromyxobacter sp. Red801]|uniref:HTH domain-containing protein n=1 Tax=Anaeromyxobacter sp. Red801 TaxID=3411632 RepID=UPI003B9F44FE
MTFTEAAIEVLRREGKPLHFRKIAEIAIRENLLDHVGKIPEETLADQLAAHCRLPHSDRRMLPVQPGTFALSEWGLDEDPHGLENLIEPPPENELPYRGRERHPAPSREMARATGRGEAGRGRRREEEERRARRFPPPAEVAYEILAGAGRALTLAEIALQGTERMLMPDAFVRDTASLSAALAEDNRRREASGRRPLFQVEGEAVTLIAQPEPGERPAAPAPRPAAAAPGDLRRAALAALRRRLRECEPPTVEHVAIRMLEKLGYREVKVAKRGREHVVCTARRRMGLADLRHAVRIVRTGAEASRRDVTELRRDLVHYGAQLGVVVTAGDAARDARGEASAAGQLPVILLCGEGFAEAMTEAGLGCVPVVVPEVDDAFFQAAAEAAAAEESARLARREERDRREERGERGERDRRRDERREPRRDERPRPAAEGLALEASSAQVPEAVEPAVAAGARVVEVPAELAAEELPAALPPGAGPIEDEDEGGEDEGPEGAEGPEGEEEPAEVAANGAAGEPGAGERRRRRRRRRRRGGRGRNREGAGPQAAGAPGEGAAPAAGPAAAADEPAWPRAVPESAPRATPPPLPSEPQPAAEQPAPAAAPVAAAPAAEPEPERERTAEPPPEPGRGDPEA